MAPVIRLIGRSGSGKTTLLEGVVRELVTGGLRVAVMKHAHHAVDLDRRGKDSFRFAQAGARRVTVVSQEKVAAFRAVAGDEPSLEKLVAEAGNDIDVVLAEGFHDADAPYLLLLDARDRTDKRPARGTLLGVIGANEDDGQPLHRSDPGAVAACIRAWLAANAYEAALERQLAAARAFHGHLCPGQLLGVRLAMLGCREIGLEEPRLTKKLIAWVETDRCGADAVQTVTGCKLGKRTLKFVDNGKLAATFLNTETGVAVRVVARSDARERAGALYPALDRHDAQTKAYRELPDSALFDVQRVEVEVGEFDRPGKPVLRVRCAVCDEEVNDGRHVDGDDGPLCRSCAGGAYYRHVEGRASEARR